MMLKKIGALLGATLLLFGAVGCGEAADGTNGTTRPNKLDVTTAGTTTTAAPLLDYNPLTGEYDITVGADTRPVAFMIGNNEKSRPQYGIDEADLFVEGETEGGITRIMAVFSGLDQVPDVVGPNRSARSPFITFARGLDAIYSHAGGSKPALDTLKTGVLDNINALYYDGSTYWRDKDLWAKKGMEYSMMTSGENIAARVKKLKYETTTDRGVPYVFGTPSGDGAGEQVQVKFSNYQTISFRYDEKTDLYTKINGTLDKGKDHVMANGNVITTKNIFILYADRYVEYTSKKKGTIYNFKLTSGTGYAVSGGKSREFNWKIDKNGIYFTETDGSTAVVAPGKSYICFVDTPQKANTKLL